MAATKRRLGRGLGALLDAQSRSVRDTLHDAQTAPGDDEPSFAIQHLNVRALTPGQYQPRQTLAEDSLAELADSIREQGVLQPLVVRPLADVPGRDSALTHEIVAGERRWRASQLAGLSSVPVIERDLDDQSALAVALIENLQREDLNPVEQARSLARLAREFELTHEQVASAVGRSRSAVTNLLRLLELEDEVRDLLGSGRISMGHARAMLALKGKQQVKLARQAVRSAWSVRQVEKAVKRRLDAIDRPPVKPEIDLQSRWLQAQLAAETGSDVSIRKRKSGSYTLNVGFEDLEQLQTALQGVQELVGQVHQAAGPRARDRQET